MKTIKAKDGMYLTQVSVENEENRIFIREIAGMSVNEADLRDASAKEKAEWEQEHQNTIEQ